MNNFSRLFQGIEVRYFGRWFFYASIVGLVAGLGAAFFHFLLGIVSEKALMDIVGYTYPLPGGEGGGPISAAINFSVKHRWLFLVVPTVGGLISGFFIFVFAPEAAGHGTDAVVDAFHNKRGYIRPIVPVIKTIASAVTIGTGGSAGREGPIAQIGAGFASLLGKWLKLSARDRRILIMCGAGAGIGAIFRAPLGGAIFGAEVLYRQADFETDVMVPAIITSIFAYIVFGWIYGFTPIFRTFPFEFRVNELPYYGLLGLFLVPFGFIYVKVFYKTRDFFDRLSIPSVFKPAIGGFFMGILLMFIPQVAGTSYGWLQEALYGKLALGLLFFIAIGKIIGTALAIGSGGSGGVFAPSLVIGASLGGLFGRGIQILIPNSVESYMPFILIGMGSYFAAVGKVPLTSLVIVAEMTGNYSLLVPMTLAVSLAFLLSGRWSIYEKQVSARMDSPAHRGDFIVDVLEDIEVREATKLPQKVPCFPSNMPVTDALKRAASVPFHCFPVVDDGKLAGFLYSEDLRAVLYRGELTDIGSILVVNDIAREKVPVLSPKDNLDRALSLFLKTGLDELPILEEGKCTGILSRKELITAYDRELYRRKVESES